MTARDEEKHFQNGVRALRILISEQLDTLGHVMPHTHNPDIEESHRWEYCWRCRIERVLQLPIMDYHLHALALPAEPPQNIQHVLEAFDALAKDVDRVSAETPLANEYPKPCGLCPGTIESREDLEWHGLGNCVDICEHCEGSGIDSKPKFITADDAKELAKLDKRGVKWVQSAAAASATPAPSEDGNGGSYPIFFCTCGHDRATHEISPPYPCAEDCDCKSFTFQKKTYAPNAVGTP